MKDFADAFLKLLSHFIRVKRLVLTQIDVFVNVVEESCNEQLKLLLLLSILFVLHVRIFSMKDHLIFTLVEEFEKVYDDGLLYVTFDAGWTEISYNIFKILFFDHEIVKLLCLYQVSIKPFIAWVEHARKEHRIFGHNLLFSESIPILAALFETISAIKVHLLNHVLYDVPQTNFLP